MNKSQWRKEHTTVFSIRINNDTGLVERIKQAAQDSNISINQFFIQAITKELNRASQVISVEQPQIKQVQPSPSPITIQIVLPDHKEEHQ